jgi:hypothetical protein
VADNWALGWLFTRLSAPPHETWRWSSNGGPADHFPKHHNAEFDNLFDENHRFPFSAMSLLITKSIPRLEER